MHSRKNTQHYVWEWVGGGYNSCHAETLEIAKEMARIMGLPSREGGTTLVPVNVRRDPGMKLTFGYDSRYAGLCD